MRRGDAQTSEIHAPSSYEPFQSQELGGFGRVLWGEAGVTRLPKKTKVYQRYPKQPESNQRYPKQPLPESNQG
jgi:hypothetical protein